jgi:Txe/YoeB family toxin of toxin-antitoxin system
MYRVELSKRAVKDLTLLNIAGLRVQVMKLLYIISDNPFQSPPHYKKLVGYSGRYSRRINKKHRLVYEIDGNLIRILSMWSHYE